MEVEKVNRMVLTNHMRGGAHKQAECQARHLYWHSACLHFRPLSFLPTFSKK